MCLTLVIYYKNTDEIHRCTDANTSTFVLGVQNTYSWLDHVVTNNSGLNISIDCINVLNDFVMCDHMPLHMSIDFRLYQIHDIKC